MAGFAAIALAQGKLERGARLMAAIDAALSAMGIRLLHMDRRQYERNLAFLQAKLGEKTLNKFWSRGGPLPFE
jgi:hypothetical protein